MQIHLPIFQFILVLQLKPYIYKEAQKSGKFTLFKYKLYLPLVQYKLPDFIDLAWR
jgi:hypothetical protein